MRTVHVRDAKSAERGVALITSLLVLMLISTVAVTYMATTVTERSVSANVHVAKGSLYAADAGVRTAQQMLANMAQVKLDSVCNVWSGVGPVITQPGALFPAGQLLLTRSSPSFSAAASIAFADSDLADTAQVYNYRYTITSGGAFGQRGSRQVQSDGVLRVSAERGSFTDYLIYTNTHLMPSGDAIWFTSSGYFDGRVHTNTQFRFAYQPTFEDLTSQVNSRSWFYNRGSPIERAANNNGSTDVPNFHGGFNRSAPSIPLPNNAFNQQNAALGLNPSSSTPPSNTVINTILGTGGGSSTPPNGVYVVNSGGAVTGGLYVQGTLNSYRASVDNNGRQVYALTQGATTKTITIDRAANQTLVSQGAGTTTYTGCPRGVTFVNGTVSSLRGPDRVNGSPPPAIAEDNQLLLAATGDIVVNGDVTVENYNSSSSTGVLGLLSATGDVRVGGSAPQNCNLDAFVMAFGNGKSLKVDNYDSGSPRGTFHLRGGMITERYGAFYTFNNDGSLRTGFARDFRYDRRGLIPPYFPTTNRFEADMPTARVIAWREL